MTEVIWKPALDPGGKEDFTGYFVSNTGDVQTRKRPKFPKILYKWKQSKGYICANLYLGRDEEGKKKYKCVTVHSLLLASFEGPRPEGWIVRHKNGNKEDNRLENLAWGTGKENWNDAVAHGTATIGVKNGRAKLTPDDVREIRRLCAVGETLVSIAKRFGISDTTVSDIRNRVYWKEVK